jgi:hypothetical protein
MMEVPGGRHCFRFSGLGGGSDEQAEAQTLNVQVFDRQVLGRGSAEVPAPIAQMAPFARLRPGQREFVVGIAGPFAGWLGVRPERADAQRLLALPWSTCALWRLGQQLRTAPGETLAAPAADGGDCSSP